MSRLLTIVTLIACLQGCASTHHAIVQADKVTLFLNAPQAKQVQFATSIDRYTVHEATKNSEGTWMATELVNQEFQYFYLVDGKPFIPDCRFRQDDDFGTTNCRYLP